MREILDEAGFEDITITKKENSEQIIKSWNIRKGIEGLTFSAYIQAKKPKA